MKGVPPAHREVDNRDVHGTDDGNDARSLISAALIVNGRMERNKAEIEEEENQHGCQASIPHPVCAPRRPSPECTRKKRNKAHEGAGRRHRFAPE